MKDCTLLNFVFGSKFYCGCVVLAIEYRGCTLMYAWSQEVQDLLSKQSFNLSF